MVAGGTTIVEYAVEVVTRQALSGAIGSANLRILDSLILNAAICALVMVAVITASILAVFSVLPEQSRSGADCAQLERRQLTWVKILLLSIILLLLLLLQL